MHLSPIQLSGKSCQIYFLKNYVETQSPRTLATRDDASGVPSPAVRKKLGHIIIKDALIIGGVVSGTIFLISIIVGIVLSRRRKRVKQVDGQLESGGCAAGLAVIPFPLNEEGRVVVTRTITPSKGRRMRRPEAVQILEGATLQDNDSIALRSEERAQPQPEVESLRAEMEDLRRVVLDLQAQGAEPPPAYANDAPMLREMGD